MEKNNDSFEITLVPYCEVDGIRTFTDTEVLDLYDRMAINGTAKAVFSDGQILSREDWLETMKFPHNFMYVVFSGDKIVAAVWLNRVEMKKAHFNYCAFFNGWRMGSVKGGRMIMDTVMEMKSKDGEYLFDVLMGVTPAVNTSAVKYMKLCGWIILGEVPLGVWNQEKQKSEPALISYYSRKEVSDENLQ